MKAGQAIATLVLAAWGGMIGARLVHSYVRPRAPAAPPDGPIATANPGPADDRNGAKAMAGAPTTLHGEATRADRSPYAFRGRPRLAWTFDAGAPIVSGIVASPDGGTLYATTLGGDLVALDRAGTARFRVPLGDKAYGTPLVADDGAIFVGSDAKRFFGIAPDGTIRFRLEVAGEADTSPARLDADTIVFAAGAEVYAVRRSGDVAWRYRAGGKVFTAPAVTRRGTVVFGSHDHHAYGVSSAGAPLFRVDLGADVDGGPAIDDDGTIAFGTDAGEVVFLDDRGAVHARKDLGGFVRGPLSFARNGDVVVGTYGPAPRFVRVAPDGRVVFALPIPGTGATEFGIHGGAVEDAEGRLFFGAQDDLVRGVSRTGEALFEFAAGDDVDSPIALLGDGVMAFGCDDGKVRMVVSE